MPIITNLEDKILQLVRSNQYQWFTVGVNLGGVSGEEGGSGIPLGGFIGQLIQSKVTFDTTEASTLDIPASGQSLVDNLNRMRYWIFDRGLPLAVQNEGVEVASGITIMDFVGAPVDVTYSGGKAIVTISGTGAGGGGEIVKVSSNDTVANYLEDKITAGGGITLAVLNEGANEELEITVGDITDDQVLMDTLGTPTYTTLEDYWNTIQSAGIIWGGNTTDNLDGTVAVASGRGIIKTTDDHLGANVFFNWNTDSSVSLTNDSTNFIYIDYNDGTPIIESAVTLSSLDLHTQILVSRAYREDTDLHIWNVGQDVSDYAKDACLKDFEVFGPSRAEGLIISEISERKLAMTAGVLYCAHNRTIQSALDTSVSDTFSYWYRDAGVGWTEQTGQTQISNAYYDDGDGTLGALSSNRYGVHWIYVLFDGTLHVQYGQGDYTSPQAFAANVPSPPSLLANFGLLIARVIIQEGETSFTDLATTFETTFTSNQTPDHGDLAGLTDDDHEGYALADGSRTFDLGELENVTITSPAEGESLTYDSGTWVNALISGGGGGGSSYTYALEDVTSQIPAGGDDFTLAAEPASGALVLHFNGLTQQPNNYNISGAGFHTLFSPISGDELVAEYYTDVPSENILGLTLEVQASGVSVAQNVEILNFNGMVVTDEGSGKVTVSGGTGTGGGGGDISIKDEGGEITSGVTSIDFVGSSVVATADGDAVTINIGEDYPEFSGARWHLASDFTYTSGWAGIQVGEETSYIKDFDTIDDGTYYWQNYENFRIPEDGYYRIHAHATFKEPLPSGVSDIIEFALWESNTPFAITVLGPQIGTGTVSTDVEMLRYLTGYSGDKTYRLMMTSNVTGTVVASGTAYTYMEIEKVQGIPEAVTMQGCRVILTGFESVDHDTDHDIEWDYDTGSHAFDSGDFWTSGAASRFTIPSSGYYNLYCYTRWQANDTGIRKLWFEKNGTDVLALSQMPALSDNDGYTQAVKCDDYFETDDYIEVYCYHDKGSASGLEGDTEGQKSAMHIHKTGI